MTCQRCEEEDNFIEGNEEQEICKNCLDHCCESCFKELETEEEYETHNCSECYPLTISITINHQQKKKEPRYFTFTNREIYNYNISVINKKTLKPKKQIKRSMSL